MRLILVTFVALLVAAPLRAQGGYVPRSERGQFSARTQSTIGANRVRATLFNFGQSGRTGAASGEIPYEWPQGSRQHYVALVGLFVGAQVTSEAGQQVVIVDIPNYRSNPDNPNDAWTWAPVPQYLGGGQAARSDRPETWPAVWPDRLGDATDPGWAGSWNGFLGKDAIIDGVEVYTHYTDDGYNRNRRSASTAYYPDSTDRARAGLGIVVSERQLAFRDPLVEDAVFTVSDLYNAGTEDLAAVGATVWIADLIGGDADAGDDVPLFDDARDLIVFSDRDGRSTDPAFPAGQSVAAAALVLLEAPGARAFATVRHQRAGGVNFQTARDDMLYTLFMVPAPYQPPTPGSQDDDTFASVAPFPLAAGTSARFATALVFGTVNYSATDFETRYAEVLRKAEQARAFYAGGFATPAEAAPADGGFELQNVSPNPSSAELRVVLSLPAAETMRLDVLDMLGRRVAVLHSGEMAAGTHVLRLDTSRLPGGVYVVRASGATSTRTQRITVLH